MTVETRHKLALALDSLRQEGYTAWGFVIGDLSDGQERDIDFESFASATFSRAKTAEITKMALEFLEDHENVRSTEFPESVPTRLVH